jgi:hypothetical protein
MIQDALRTSRQPEKSWRRWSPDITDDGGTPEAPALPPTPAMFQPDVPAVGDPAFAKLARRMVDLEPSIKARTKAIHAGPSAGQIVASIDAGLDPNRWPIRLWGTASEASGGPPDAIGRRWEVGINPDIDTLAAIHGPTQAGFRGQSTFGILAHELGHVGGFDEPEAYRLSDTAQNWRNQDDAERRAAAPPPGASRYQRPAPRK